MIKHPKELGFTLALKIHIGQPAHMTEPTPNAPLKDVVYVILDEDAKELERGDAFKIGQTGDLMRRCTGLVGIFNRNNLRENEREDRDKWLKAADRKQVSVWVRAAGKIEVPYAKGLTETFFSTRCAEEEFLDQYYCQMLGKSLNRL
jgi:hypothetical protein